MNGLDKTNAKNVTPSTQVDDINNPRGFSDKKLVAKATAAARPKYSRVTHKAIGSKGSAHKVPAKKTVAPKKEKLPFTRKRS